MKKLISTLFIILAIVPFYSLPMTTEAALIGIDPFEDCNSDYYQTTSGTFSFETATPITGDCSLRTNPTGTAVGYVNFIGATSGGLFSSSATAGLNSAWFRVDTLPAAGMEQLFAVYNGGTEKGYGVVDSSGYIGLYTTAGVQVGATSSTAVAAGAATFVLQWFIPNGTSATGEIIINGTETISGTANWGASAPNVTRLGKAKNLMGNSVDYKIDNAMRSTISYTGDHTTIGKKMVPDSNGESGMYWTAGDATCNATPTDCYLQVDERGAFDTTTYTQAASTTPNTALFDLEDTASQSISGTIEGCMVGISSREVTSGAGAPQLMLVSGAATTTANYTTATIMLGRVMESFTDPNTSAAWTTSGLDAVEVGANEQPTSVVQNRISTAHLSCMYTPAAVVASDNTDQEEAMFID